MFVPPYNLKGQRGSKKNKQTYIYREIEIIPRRLLETGNVVT